MLLLEHPLVYEVNRRKVRNLEGEARQAIRKIRIERKKSLALRTEVKGVAGAGDQPARRSRRLVE